MHQNGKATDWPEGFEAWIRAHRFTEVEDLLLWDCSVMCECFEAGLARWMERSGRVNTSELRRDEWKHVRIVANEMALQRHGRTFNMKAIRWGCKLAERLEGAFYLARS
jgi:hypothetical protein